MLEFRYQQFISSNANFATEECIGWHGTSALCRFGNCRSLICSLCQIVRHGFKKECARKDSYSHDCWGDAIYFSSHSFVCHTFNGASELNYDLFQRRTIMAKLNRGHTIDENTFDVESNGKGVGRLPQWIAEKGYDTVILSRDYYIAPTNYLLVFNNCAVIPLYIVIYSYPGRETLRIRRFIGEYCSFHNEHHKEGTRCDGNCHQGCLGNDENDRSPPKYRKRNGEFCPRNN